MTNYAVTTNFGAKDTLISGNALKALKGAELTTEFTNIATAVATKRDANQTVSVFDFMTAAQQNNVSLNLASIEVTAAINAAVTYLSTIGGGTILYPAGRYLVGVTSQVNYATGNIYHQGSSSEISVIVNGNASLPAFTIGNGATIFYGGGIEKLCFTGQTALTGLNGQTAFTFNKMGQFRIRDVFITNFMAALYRGAYFSVCSQFQVYGLRAQLCLNDGVTMLGTTDAYITDSRSDANGGAGWALNGAQGCYFKGDTAFNNTGAGYSLISGAPTTSPNKNNFFLQCVGDTSGTYNWQISDSQDSSWVQCWGSTQQSITVNTFATGFVVYTQNCKRLHFTACFALTNNSHGFQLLDTGASAPVQITLDNCQFTLNGAAAGGGYGVTMNGNCNGIRVNSGNLSSNATGSFQNQSALSDIIVSECVGFVSINQGAGVIVTTATSVAITHGLGFTPNAANIQMTDTSSKAASGINSAWISATSSTTFTVTVNAAVAGVSYNFAWRASYNGT